MREMALFNIMLLLLVVTVGCSPSSTVDPVLPQLKAGPTPVAAGVEGHLAPHEFVELSVNSPGVMTEVLVSEGDQVQAGQVLARLNGVRMKLAVDESHLKLAQAELDLTQAQKPADAAELAAAQRAVWADQAALANARAIYSTTIESAQIAEGTAQLVLERTQRDYNHLLDLKKWGHDVEDDLKTELLQLTNARTDLGIARRNTSNAPARAAQAVAEGQQALAASQAHYEALKRLPDTDRVKAAELVVESAKLALKEAEANLEDTVIRAPIAGVVAEVKSKAGQSVEAGTPLFTLADTSVWVVDTSNLNELSVVDLGEGHRARVKFDAIPGLEMTGHIESIGLRAQPKQGDVLYATCVTLDGSDPRLRWGMTSFVQFEK